MTLLGNYFRSRRAEMKMSQFDLALASGIQHGTISALERRGSCSLKKAVQIAKALGLDSIPVS
jgi:transcriptional regulator with XRE-family HTH domain